MTAVGGMSPRSQPAPVRDGVGLICTGVGGWGLAPLLGHPSWALPALIVGCVLGVAVMVLGRRRALREQLLRRAEEAVLPLLGIAGGRRGRRAGNVLVSRWTQGWPGHPRRVRIGYGTGRLKLLDAAVEVGDPRWASEVARTISGRFDVDYTVGANNAHRGRLTLRVRPPSPDRDEVPETEQVLRAKRVVDELLGGTADVASIETTDDGEVSRMKVTHAVGSKLVAPGYRRRVERAVSVMLPGRWRAQWDMEGDSVLFEVRPTLPESVWIPSLELPDDDPLSNYRAVEVPYGVDEDGEVMTWRPAINPQWLITGGTGSGKTSTTHGILTRIAAYGWPVWIADGKGVEFLGFRDWPNIQVVASRIEQQVAVIHRAWELMEYRYQLVVDGLARTEDFEPLVVFVDEFTDLKANLLTWYASIKVKGDPTKPVTLAEVGSIARKGRTSRVHMVLAMQRPDAEILTGEARENFGQRTSMGPLSPEGATMMWNNPVVGVTLPRGRIGRAIGMNAAGIPVEMQCYRVPDPKDLAEGTPEHQLLTELRPSESRQERLVIVPPEIDWSAEEPTDPTFTHYAEAEWARAEDRPELDPLAGAKPGAAGGDVDGRTLSSPMTLFGLTGSQRPGSRSWSRTSSRGAVGVDEAAPPPADGTSPELEEPATGGAGDGYGPVGTTAPAQLRVGDLVLVDEDLDAWAVVEDEPLSDFVDEDSLVVPWRDDQDSSGQLIVSADAQIPVRRPTEGQ